MEAVSSSSDHDALTSQQRGDDTLSTLHHETPQAMELMHKQLYVKDNIIADLKARLARYENTYMTVGENEPVLLGPSMSLLESLCNEICKHKQKRSELELKTSRQAQEIQTLRAECRQKEEELERVRHEAGHEKDEEIRRLHTALQEKERLEATRAVLCTSLTEEAQHLRSQLGATVKVCKDLLARLEKGLEKDMEKGLESKEARREEEGRQQTGQREKVDTTEEVERLQQENQQLKQRVAYVQRLNSQWQKYDSSREDYIRGLCQRLQEVPGLGPVSSTMLCQEISRLNDLLEDKMEECVRVRREMEDARRHDTERIQMLEQQVLIYTEDFKSERNDRERAQGQIQGLKEQLRQLKHLHRQGAAVHEGRARDQDIVPLCRVHIGHRIAPRRRNDPEHLVQTADRQQQPPPLQSPPQGSDQSELRCPRCQAQFDDTQAAQYFDHWEECARI
ncbi:TNFAIP3-interacting protein 2 isoform X2 [Periophthalmus magnuspinnatus]|uniref:TNFAIP3-interacting protein 2 isoform X2 n=1 Tax=Periophthalmus magnuspinnatus TaxID=409849 RepID=UPI00145B2EAF|nr:TNFAIP3-interacting protein 2 isoform X2 [Periophthalmus magnuspinnatus]